MIRFEEYRFKLLSLEKNILELKNALNLENLSNELAILQKQTETQNFYLDSENMTIVLRNVKSLELKIQRYTDIYSLWQDLISLCDMSLEANDADMIDELIEQFQYLQKIVSDYALETLLTGEYDKNNAIISFHAGAGGTEAQDWAEMLYRMYTRFAERRGYKYKLLSYLDGDGAGIKSADILIEGENAFGFLKSEMGVHRLVRISPFDSSGRRHTSFAAIEVMPEIEQAGNIDIKSDDLRIDTFRAGGAGGQHVNTTDSAVRITHIPSGVVVSCQNERSQIQNRETAMKMLYSKLIQIQKEQHLDKIDDIKGELKKIEWGSQIRSYVFMPYTLVKDHRTNFENGNINAVMDGEIDGFLNAYLKQNL